MSKRKKRQEAARKQSVSVLPGLYQRSVGPSHALCAPSLLESASTLNPFHPQSPPPRLLKAGPNSQNECLIRFPTPPMTMNAPARMLTSLCGRVSGGGTGRKRCAGQSQDGRAGQTSKRVSKLDSTLRYLL